MVLLIWKMNRHETLVMIVNAVLALHAKLHDIPCGLGQESMNAVVHAHACALLEMQQCLPYTWVVACHATKLPLWHFLLVGLIVADNHEMLYHPGLYPTHFSSQYCSWIYFPCLPKVKPIIAAEGSKWYLRSEIH